jgi:hypothetical protein
VSADVCQAAGERRWFCATYERLDVGGRAIALLRTPPGADGMHEGAVHMITLADAEALAEDLRRAIAAMREAERCTIEEG